MMSNLQHELIVLPAAARPEIPARLRSVGMDVIPSQQPLPANFKGAGTLFVCRENKGSAEIFIIDHDALLPEHGSMVAVLILPGRGRLADWFSGTKDLPLRDKIHSVLYALKSELEAPRQSPASA